MEAHERTCTCCQHTRPIQQFHLAKRSRERVCWPCKNAENRRRRAALLHLRVRPILRLLAEHGTMTSAELSVHPLWGLGPLDCYEIGQWLRLAKRHGLVDGERCRDLMRWKLGQGVAVPKRQDPPQAQNGELDAWFAALQAEVAERQAQRARRRG